MHHTIDICQEIAERLRSPAALDQIMENEIRQGTTSLLKWPDNTLAAGLPGIACFYAVMDHAFPDQQWDDVAHQYLKLAATRYQTFGYKDCSLFFGLSGFSFAGYLCSKKSRYQTLLKTLDVILVQEIERILIDIRNLTNSEHYLAPHHYNLMHGLSGIIAYLLLRQEDRWFQKLATDCIDALVSLLATKKMVENFTVPAWYVSPQHQFGNSNHREYTRGSFILSTLSGITGCLSIFSIAAWHGNTSPFLHQMIKQLATWLEEKKIMIPSGPIWPYMFSLETEPNKEPSLQKFYSDGWSSGRPSVLISLYLAGLATQDQALKTFSEEVYVSLFPQFQNNQNVDPSFSSGTAGLLATTYRMAKLTNNAFLMRQATSLEHSLKQMYNPSLPFGFQMITTNQQSFNDPGLLNGSAGIALALLLADGRTEQIAWDRAFLLC